MTTTPRPRSTAEFLVYLCVAWAFGSWQHSVGAGIVCFAFLPQIDRMLDRWGQD